MAEKIFSKIVGSQFKALGTNIDVQIVVKKNGDIFAAEKDLEKIKDRYNKIEKIFSRFDPRSELSCLNSHPGVFLPVSEEMKAVAESSLKFYGKTKGFFDPRIIGFLECAGYDRDFKSIFCSQLYKAKGEANPFARNLSQDLVIKKNKICFKIRMDFSGIVKGYATDIVARFLSEKGWQNFLVDSGGDIYFSGQDEKNNNWTVDIEGAPENKIMFGLSNKGIATSGISRRKWEKDGKRFHHLINPKNPRVFSFDLKSVTVIAEDTTEADVLAKAVFLMGANEAKKYVEARNLPSAILDYKGNVWLSSSIKDFNV